jgi:phosphodiesterase/alkaline phosphatase D-like protein
VTGITRTGATVSWTTDAPSDSTVEYGTTTAYGQIASAAELVTSHAVTLSGLNPATRYFVRVTSASAGGAIARATTSFTTAP